MCKTLIRPVPSGSLKITTVKKTEKEDWESNGQGRKKRKETRI